MALPTYYYLKYFEQSNLITFLKLDSTIKKGVKYIIIASIILCSLHLNQQYVHLRSIIFNPFFKKNIYIWLDTVILAAFMDEIVFRGVILQKANNLMSFWKVNFVNALLFVLIHFPAWNHYNYLVLPKILGLIHFTFWFGIAMGYILKKSNSLWPCILIHMINNFLSYSLK